MGSRIMHVVIANEIAKRTGLHNRESFVIGGLAPDAVTTKEQSHFFVGHHEDGTRDIDVEAFRHKYKLNSYVLGYEIHLLADRVWLRGFYMSWLKNRLDVDPFLRERYHADFNKLNGILIDYYQCRKDVKGIATSPYFAMDLDEVSISQIDSFLPILKEDINGSNQNESLEVFSFAQIIGYIETCIGLGVHRVNQIMELEGSI